MINTAKFTVLDESFVCEVCGMSVTKLGYTARDHCPNCLCSKHVDINPGDRLCECNGILEPIAIDYTPASKKSDYKIVYKCKKCGQIHRNYAARDDNFDLILSIMSNPVGVAQGHKR